MEAVFITGVDTGVGKSAVCAGLLRMMYGQKKACYWKPIQTGTIVSDDTREVKRLTQLPPDAYMEPSYRFVDPLSPYVAAKKWGKTINVDDMVKVYQQKQAEGYFVIFEGAGGLLVPYNDRELQIDFIEKLKVPTLFIAEDRVGAINQTLLSVNAMRARKLAVVGVILTRSRRNFGNAECISHFGKIEIIAEFDPAESAQTLSSQVGGNRRLREIFEMPQLPE